MIRSFRIRSRRHNAILCMSCCADANDSIRNPPLEWFSFYREADACAPGWGFRICRNQP